jgi:hypothetical protein
MSTPAYHEQPQTAFDIEHPADWVKFGVKFTASGTGIAVETSYTYAVQGSSDSPEISKDATPNIVGGETYILTQPPVEPGSYVVEMESSFGLCGKGARRFTVYAPQNSRLL